MKKLALILLCIATLISAFGVFTAHAQDATIRVRLAHLSYDAGEVDLLIDGSPVFSAEFGTITRYFENSAGTYQLAVVPTGQGIESAVLGPADVVFEAGHSYTLAAIGQQADMSFSPLIIDETTTLENANVTSDSPMILLNALSGAPALDIYTNDAPTSAQLSFGGYVAADATAGEFELSATAAGDTGNVLFEQVQLGVPNNLLFVAVAGIADDFTVFTSNASSLNAVEFLSGLSGTVYSVDSLLAAASAAGLSDSLANQGPFTLFAPLDSAFTPDMMNQLVADPDLLTSVLSYHIVPDYVSSADIVDGLIENGSVTLTTVQTGDITVSNADGSVLINDSAQLLGVDFYVSNGVIHFIDGILEP